MPKKNQKDDQENSNNGTNKVSFQLPKFYRQNPSLWFYHLEAQFENNQIFQEKIRLNYLLGNIDWDITEIIVEIIKGDKEDKYSLAKKRILVTFEESTANKLKKLTGEIELGDLRPSQLLRKMQVLADNDIYETALKTLWLEKLPRTIKKTY